MRGSCASMERISEGKKDRRRRRKKEEERKKKRKKKTAEMSLALAVRHGS